jgi:raffinose/stachyose/melibiose transport system permease protein
MTVASQPATRQDGARDLTTDPGRPSPRHTRWWPFAVVALALTIGFFLIPFLLNVYFAFTDWTGFSAAITPNGFDNFVSLTDTGVLGNAVRVTVLYAVVAMVLQNAVSLGLALLLQRTTAFNSWLRTLFFIPVLISPLAAGYIWGALLSPKGPLNQAVGLVLPGFDFAWLGGGGSALVSVAFVDVWKWSGLATLVYIAGLNAIPPSLIEAAIDGATRPQIYRLLILPALLPILLVGGVILIITIWNEFLFALFLLRGPGAATLPLALYQFSSRSSEFAAMSWELIFAHVVLTSLPLIVVYLFVQRRLVSELSEGAVKG